MTPQAREALAVQLDRARTVAAARATQVRTAPDAVLCRVMGIADAAACRRIASTARVARRIWEPLRAGLAEQERQAPAVPLEEDFPTDPDAVRLVDDTGPQPDGADGGQPAATAPVPDGERIVRMVAAAIRLSSTGVLLTRDDLDGALSLHGAEAVDFGLANRSHVPAWMREAAGSRDDLHRQLAASCVAALAQTLPPEVAEPTCAALLTHEPLPLGTGAARAGAERLAQLAVDFAATYSSHPADAPAGTH